MLGVGLLPNRTPTTVLGGTGVNILVLALGTRRLYEGGLELSLLHCIHLVVGMENLSASHERRTQPCGAGTPAHPRVATVDLHVCS